MTPITPQEVLRVNRFPSMVQDEKIFPDKKLVDDHRYFHMWQANNWATKPHELTIAVCERVHDIIARELVNRGFKHDTPIHVAPSRGEGQESFGSRMTYFPKTLASSYSGSREHLKALEMYVPTGGYGVVTLDEVLPLLREIELWGGYRPNWSVEKREVVQDPFVWITGRIVNEGMTCEDIDFIVKSPVKWPQVEWELSKILHVFPNPKQVTFDITGPHVGWDLPVYRLVADPKGIFVLEPLGFSPHYAGPEEAPERYPSLITGFESRGIESLVGHRERLKELGKKKSIRIFEPFLPLKPSRKAFFSLEDFSKEKIVENWPEAFLNAHMREVAVEKKFDGVAFVVHKKRERVELHTISGEDRTKFLPHVLEDAKRLNIEEAILVGELVPYDPQGVALGRNAAAKAIHGDEPCNDEHWVLHVYDIVWKDGESLVDRSYKERRMVLGKLKDFPHVEKNKVLVAQDPDMLLRYIKEMSKEPWSEGAMLKLWEGSLSEYSLSGRTRGWIKYKHQFEIDARVVRKIPKRETKTGEIIPGQWVYECEIDHSIIGKTFSTAIDADKGNILRVGVQVIRKLGPREFHWVIPEVLELREDVEEPDGYDVAARIAKETEFMVSPPSGREKEGVEEEEKEEKKISLPMIKLPDIIVRVAAPKVEVHVPPSPPPKVEVKVDSPQVDVKPHIEVKPSPVTVVSSHPKKVETYKEVTLDKKKTKQIEKGYEKVVEE